MLYFWPHSSDLTDCRKVLETECKLTGVTDEDCSIVRRVCEAVSGRAARLAGAGIVTVVRKINRLDKCTVAVDGSLFKFHPQFKHKLASLMVNKKIINFYNYYQ